MLLGISVRYKTVRPVASVNVLFVQSIPALNIAYPFIYILTKYSKYTAKSIKVDIDNSQMCNMIDRVPKE